MTDSKYDGVRLTPKRLKALTVLTGKDNLTLTQYLDYIVMLAIVLNADAELMREVTKRIAAEQIRSWAN